MVASDIDMIRSQPRGMLLAHTNPQPATYDMIAEDRVAGDAVFRFCARVRAPQWNINANGSQRRRVPHRARCQDE